MRTALLCALIVLLAGCSGGSSETSGTDGTPGEVKTEDGDIVRADLGAIRGRVHDDVNFSLQGARVSLLGTDHFTSTGSDGQFRMVNVTAGTHDLQVRMAGFKVFRGEVDIQAGQTLRVEIEMQPTQARGGGFQPHKHDFWAGSDTYLLMDDDIDLQTDQTGDQSTIFPVQNGVVNPLTNDTAREFFLPPDEPGHPSIVVPGTSEMRVTFTWDDATTTMETMGFAYGAPREDTRPLAPKASGKTWTVPVAPEHADNGHQLWTFWNFYYYFGEHPSDATEYDPAIAIGSLHIKIELVGGETVLDPPHEDFWGSNDTLVLADHQKTAAGTLCCVDRPSFHQDLRLGAGKIVPPGTDRLRFRLDWDLPHDPWEQVRSYSLAWRTADMDPNTPRGQYVTAQPTAGGGPQDKYVEYEIDIEPEETDAFYQRSSFWRWVWLEDPEGDVVPFYSGWNAPELQFSVTAFRD